MKLIDISTPTYPNTFTMVDDADFDFLSQWKWYAGVSGKKKYGKVYAIRNLSMVKDGKRRTISIHQQLIKAPYGMRIDHINRNRLDNQRGNLRVCTNAQNLWNTGKRKTGRTPTSKYKGVVFTGKRYIAYGRIDDKTKNLGSFKNEDDAARAYNAWSLENHGQFALLNEV